MAEALPMHARPALALLLATILVPVAALSTACAAKASATTTPTADPNAPPLQTVTAPTAAPTMAPTGMPTGTAMTGTGPATPIAPMAAAVVQPILVGMGQNEAQGGQPDGQPFAGQFQAGQTLEQQINIKGNGCYTVVGASVGIQQLDISLVVQPPGMQPIPVAQSNTTGPNATLGGKATGCWRNPTPLAGTGKVILRATSGQGLAAAQVFSK